MNDQADRVCLTWQSHGATGRLHPTPHFRDQLCFSTFTIHDKRIDGSFAKPFNWIDQPKGKSILVLHPLILTKLICPITDERGRTGDNDFLAGRLAG